MKDKLIDVLYKCGHVEFELASDDAEAQHFREFAKRCSCIDCLVEAMKKGKK
jgi:hypothetical protein